MKIISKIEFEQNEIQTIINTLKILTEIYQDACVSSEVQLKADNAFDELADLLCLDPLGKKAYHHEGW